MPDYTDNLDQTKLNQQDQLQPQEKDAEPVVLPKYVKPVKTAADWARQLRFSADVNKTTVGVDSDRVTPDLVLATATKLLGISKGEQEPDPKDSLQFQRFYGPAEYFAEHVAKDGGKVARNLLWKATNKGNLDFINSNSLQPHVTSVFFDSNLSQFIDGSTPFDAIDATYKTTRVGQGGLQSPDSAPDEMRLVQPSYFGYVDPVRCYSADTWIYTKSGWIRVQQMNMQTQFACLVNNHMEWHKPLDVTSYKYKGIMYGYDDGIISYLVTPKHKMYVKSSIKATHLEPPDESTGFTKVYVEEIHGKSCIMMQDLYHLRELKPGNFYTEDYDGTVYCPSVPGGLVFIRKSLTSRGIWCSNTAQRGQVGLTGYLTKNVLKGSDGKLYQTFYNARTKKYQLVDSVTAAKSVMASAQYKDSKDKSIFAVGGKTGARIVDKDKVDYYADKPDNLFSLGSNLVPMLSGIKEMRLLMGCLCPWTPVVQINESGYVQIVQAIHAGMHGQVKMFSLQDDLTDKVQPLRGSHARIPDKGRPFIKVVLESGRVLPTSPDHKWVVYKGVKLVKIKADKLQPGMQIPRTIFNNAPSKQTYMLGAKLTPQIGALLACIVKGFQVGSYGRRCPFPEQLLPRIKLAVQQLNLNNCKVYKNRGICYIGLQNQRLIDWLQTQMGLDHAKRRIPSVVLSAYKNVVAGFIDAYTIQGLNIGYDVDGDVWILQIPNNILRDGLAYLFARIYTDTLFRDHKDEDGTVHRALLLKPVQGVLGQSVVLDKIKSIVHVAAPGMMIDLDVNDNVYAVANGIVTHNSKYATQAVPLEHRQAPLVRPIDSDTNKDMQTLLGRKLGAKFAPKPGVVAAVRRDRVDMVYDDGTKGSISLYNAFPANAKGWLQNTVQVKAGQHLNTDDVVASSNYTTPTGQAAMGTNLHIGYLSYKGKTYQDACVVSESAAKKLASTTMYKTGIDLQKSVKTGKSTYQSWKPGQYKKQQLQMLDDTGVVKPGTVLKRGDPMILAVRLQQPSPGTLGKRVITDVSQTWDHMHDGVVTDVVKTNNGIKVYATVTAPLQVGDKMSGAYGNKNVVAQILPDEQMPKDEKGNTLDALLSPLGIVSRTNPSQLVQAALGKVAKKTGQTIYMPQFQDYDMVQYAKDMCKKYNVPWKESIQDPQTGRKISNVFTGDAYFYKLKHIADTKMSSRGTDQYTAEGVPASGGEHGCFPASQDIITIHGKRSIAQICERQLPEYVLTFTGLDWCYKQVTDWFIYRAPVADVLKITTSCNIGMTGLQQVRGNCVITPTKNHKMYLANMQCKLAKDLVVGDALAGIGPMPTSDQKKVLLGTLLGDSSINRDGILTCDHSTKQNCYASFKYSIVKGLGARLSQQYITKAIYTTGESIGQPIKRKVLRVPKSAFIMELQSLTTTPDRVRHITRQVLDQLGNLGFCIWFLDDGSMYNRQKHKGKPMPQGGIATHGFTIQQTRLAIAWLSQFLGGCPVYQKQQQTLQGSALSIALSRQASWKVAQLVAKTIPFSAIPKSKAWLRQYCREAQLQAQVARIDTNNALGIVPIPITSITTYTPDKPGITQIPVYDFTVQGTHKYTLAGGILCSNSKRFGTMESAAMVGHGAFQTLVTDAKLIRGQSNSAFWRSLRTGEVPVVPGEPLVHRKFFAHLQGSGMQIRKTPKGISIFAMTNKDARDLSASRQLKSRSTYQTNTFRPIDGGLFGQDVFGKQGKQWGYIQLDEPIPNPVMQQPIARLLNIGVKQLQDVVAGQAQVNGLKSAQDVKQALAKIDLKKQKAKAIQAFKAAPQSKKDNLLKRYVAIANMQKNVDNAADYMLDRIPVLPPQFRPVTSHSGLTMVADSNYLYAQLLDARNDLRDAKGLPDEYKHEATKNLYRSFKQLVGLYQPQNKKLQAKNVKGLLGWALGKTSKLSAFNRKVLGSTVDTVGRGVVVPDSRMPLDTVGLPQDMAWDVFSPFVTRALVKANYTPVDALKQIKERTPQARQMLLNIMEKRPVLMNRAPTLHKLSIMGFKPRLVGGYAIKVNPSIVVPFGMDFDGNCCDFDSEIILKLSKSVLDTLRQSCYSIVNKPIQEFTMLDKQASIDVVSEMAVVRMKIGDFPKEGFPVKDSKGADVYRVADDIEVLGCDPVTGKQGFYPVYGFTEEHDCATVDVTVGGRHIIVSNNESMAAFDATSGCLEKVAPTEVGNRLVPVLRKSPVPFGTYGDRDLGWLLGAVLSDGWISNNIVGYCKQEQSKRDEFVRISRKFHENFTLHTYTQEGTGDKKKLGNSVKVHLSSATFANWLREFNLVADNSGTTRAALNKQLEQRFIDAGSEEFLFGVLSGLLDGDGSIVKNTSKTKARFSFRFATSSSLLRDSVCNLAYRLGIRYSVTTVPPRGFSGEAYIVLLSVVDMYNSVDKLSCIGSSETSMLADLRNTPPAPDKLDQIPLSTAEVDFLKPISRAHNDKSLYTALTGSRKLVPSCARYILEPYAEILEEALPVLARRIKTVDTIWCPVDSIEDAGKRSVYDIMVDEAKVYAINNGVIIWDTVNIHAPVSAKAVDQVYNKMLPQRNLIAMRSGKIAYRPQKQYIQGLYVATNMDNSKPAIPFASLQEAKQAFRQGKIDVDTPIIIKG